mmetsp:Transcript_42370/g.98131  ORF Transcript_42370/g.98131 Transcript_42370/m.98131 type:complete len:200 (-) Transcript_42370:324-923(-)
MAVEDGVIQWPMAIAISHGDVCARGDQHLDHPAVSRVRRDVQGRVEQSVVVLAVRSVVCLDIMLNEVLHDGLLTKVGSLPHQVCITRGDSVEVRLVLNKVLHHLQVTPWDGGVDVGAAPYDLLCARYEGVGAVYLRSVGHQSADAAISSLENGHRQRCTFRERLAIDIQLVKALVGGSARLQQVQHVLKAAILQRLHQW